MGKSTRAAETTRIVPAGRVLNLLYIIVSLFPVMFGLYLGLPALLDHAAIVGADVRYHAQCPAVSASLHGTAACPVEPVRVVSHYTEGTGRLQSQWITIVAPTMRRYSLTIDDPDLWNGITIGQQAAVQVWQGQITGLIVNGHALKTYDNPDLISDDNNGRLGFAGITTAVSAILLCLPLFAKVATGAPYKRSIVMTGIVLIIGAAIRLLV